MSKGNDKQQNRTGGNEKMDKFHELLKEFLDENGIKTETGRTYYEVDGQRLVFDGAELLGRYDPGTEE